MAATNPSQQTPPAEDHDFLYASQLANSVVLPMVLHSAVQLELFEILAKSDKGCGMSAAEIASKLNTSNDGAPAMLDRMLCLLASHGIVKCFASGGTRVFSLAPVCKYFIKNEMGMSMGPLISLQHGKVQTESWFHLTDAVLGGGVPFDKAHGVHAFKYPGLDQRYNQVFNEAMHNLTSLFMSKMLEGYKGFEQIKQLVDVGGGFGVSLGMITAKYPHINGINFDLPHVIQHAPSYQGVEHVGGDMFQRVPSGDAIFLKWILHDWSDQHCLKLLKNCYRAVPDNGKVIVVEGNLPEIPDTRMAHKIICQMDMHMLAQCTGGKERKEYEFLALAREAGFSGIRHQGYFYLFQVMEFYK